MLLLSLVVESLRNDRITNIRAGPLVAWSEGLLVILSALIRFRDSINVDFLIAVIGPVAQLGERFPRTEEAGRSNRLRSTKKTGMSDTL